MKSPRVDIFRPLAAATRGCRPEASTACGPTSIFRRSGRRSGASTSASAQQQQQPQPSEGEGFDERGRRVGASVSVEEDDDGSFVISVPPGAWPPHQDALLSSASEGTTERRRRQLEPSAPLPTTSGGTSGSDPSPSRAATPSNQPPSYYKIELGDGDEVQLTAGDDSSVTLSPDHNERLRVAKALSGKISRASPVVDPSDVKGSSSNEKDSKEEDCHQQRWEISDSGRIRVAVPPSPRKVSESHFKIKQEQASTSKLGVPPMDSSDSPPPLLVKSSSSSSSSSASSAASFLRAAKETEGAEGGLETVSLESPPRMTRSIFGPSLFQESKSDGGSSSDEDRRRSSSKSSSKSSKPSLVSKQASTGGISADASAEAQKRRGCGPGGCGARSDLFSTILDIFSLGGACCRQPASGCTA